MRGFAITYTLAAFAFATPVLGQTADPNASSTPPALRSPGANPPELARTNPPASSGANLAPLDQPAPQPGLGPAVPGLVTGTGPAASVDRAGGEAR